MQKLKVGLALSGGGVRGLAHIGVLKILESAQVPIHLLTGTSMGGFIGACYAVGHSPAALENEALRMSSPRHLLPLLDPALPRRGLMQGKGLIDYLSKWVGDCTFDQLRLPLALVAVDLNGGVKVTLSEGSVLEAVRATTALPGLMSPILKQDQMLVDGGLLDNLPADVAREMGADVVIAVDVSTDENVVDQVAQNLYQHRFMPDALVDLINVLWRSLIVLINEANRRALETAKPELIIRPSIPTGITVLTGLTRAAEVIAAGEKAAEDALPQLRDILQSPLLL